MAGVRWLETDTLSNQNISSALAVGAYTANADRYITAQLLVDQVAGNGDYVAYITVQVNGAGSAYRMGPKTTLAAASGETAIGFQSGVIFVRSGDVVTVYIDGLAGDTTTPDTIVRWAESTSAYEMFTENTGLSYGNAVDNSPLYELMVYTGTTVPVNLFTQNTGWTYADSVAGSVVKEIADNAGGSAAEVWAYSSRTLTQAAAEVAEAVSGSTLTITRGDTFTATLTDLAANTDYVSIDFTVKESYGDTDDQAIIRIRKNASGSGDGLLRLNGTTATAAKGSITVNSSTSITITLAADVADDLVLNDSLYYDVQYIFASSVTTATAGICKVSGDVTRSVS